jgi:uncharacterized membrane protein YiaA
VRYYHVLLVAGVVFWLLGLLGSLLDLGPNATYFVAIGAGLIALAAYEKAGER